MNISEAVIIVLVSQVPLMVYTIWNGIRRNKPEIKKMDADTKSALADAAESAGKTLAAAWERIDELERWKEEANEKIQTLTEDLAKWRNYAARLIRRLKEVDPAGEIPPFETNPKMYKVKP